MEKVIANLKTLGIDMIHQANSGHPGIVLSAAPMLYTLYAKHMHINPKDPRWINRDRLVLSAGHGSALLYAVLYMVGFLTLKDLKEFRQLSSVTPGHPEYQVTPGVDMSTGPLGQGLATAVGMAMGEKHLQTKFPNYALINYYVYCVCGDGDLMEGISYEATSLAGTLKLDNLIVLYDSNDTSLDGKTTGTFTEDVRERFDSMGWYTTVVRDGTNPKEIDKAIIRAKKSGLPSLIEVKTILGDGSLLANSHEAHGKPLTDEDITQLKKKLGMPQTPFYVDETALMSFREEVMKRSGDKYIAWQEAYENYINKECHGDETEFLKFYNRVIEFANHDKPFIKCETEATRVSNGKVLNFLASKTDLLFGGSADLFSSTKTYIQKGGDFGPTNYAGANIWFGVREHAMGAILNGLALTGYLPFGSTFLSFADYLKPAMRMSALMNLPVTYVFTHDSVSVGEDGPTHEPVEQLAMMRAIPNFNVYRPADFKEVLGVWNAIVTLQRPSAIALSRQDTPCLEKTDPAKVLHGGYIVREETTELGAVLIATGTEVSTCIKIAESLEKDGRGIRVVSMPSIELFLAMPKKYQYKILPVGVKTFFVEAGSSQGLRRFVTNDKYLITIDEFGASGKANDVLGKMNFQEEQIKKRIKELL